MAPDLLLGLEDQLTACLTGYDWPGAANAARGLADAIRHAGHPADAVAVKRVLGSLRRSRRFDEMLVIASAAEDSGQGDAQIRRQRAQAMIDLGNPNAERILESMIQDSKTPHGEANEARGLVGRIYKQKFVTDGRPEDLDTAIKAYGAVYEADRSEYLWQGINYAALLYRKGKADESRKVAQEILDALERRAAKSTAPTPPAWDVATRMEALVALGKSDEAITAAVEYVRCSDVDAFAIEGTLRQLAEVWALDPGKEPGASILATLRAYELRSQGGGIRIEAAAVGRDAGLVLEKKFGPEGPTAYTWYREGLERCASVARIEHRGKGQGTGWLVRARDFFPDRAEGELLLLTNAHVVATPEVREKATPPLPFLAEEVDVNFQVNGVTARVTSVLWCSPVKDFDASFLLLSNVPDGAEPIPLYGNRVVMADPAPRIYVIGYPGGGDLGISLYDNLLVGSDDKRLHYRTPTEPGSSGSPVFGPDRWEAVALHHAGRDGMQKLDGSGGTYQANEGISILAIQEATKKK